MKPPQSQSELPFVPALVTGPGRRYGRHTYGSTSWAERGLTCTACGQMTWTKKPAEIEPGPGASGFFQERTAASSGAK